MNELFEAQLLAPTQRIVRQMSAQTAGTYQAWEWANDGGYFEPHENPTGNPARWDAIRAVKIEVRYCGYETRPMADNGYYGTNAVPNVKDLQADAGLTPDGVIGPLTMKAICRRRVQAFEAGSSARIEIPNNLLGKTISLESAVYPASRNTYSYPEFDQNDRDPDGDHGVTQINRPLNAKFSDGSYVCPKVVNGKVLTEAERWPFAYRIGINVNLLAQHMRYYHRWLKSFKPDIDPDALWRAVVMAHNAPYWAKEWMLAGFPETGGDIVRVGNWVGTKFEWCVLYTRAVFAQSW